MSHFKSQAERQLHGEQFLCTLFALTDRNVEQEITATEVYDKISYNLGAFGKKAEKTDKGQTVQQDVINDLIHHLTHERPEPQIVVRKTH
jgi:hypothetical protein